MCLDVACLHLLLNKDMESHDSQKTEVVWHVFFLDVRERGGGWGGLVKGACHSAGLKEM